MLLGSPAIFFPVLLDILGPAKDNFKRPFINFKSDFNQALSAGEPVRDALIRIASKTFIAGQVQFDREIRELRIETRGQDLRKIRYRIVKILDVAINQGNLDDETTLMKIAPWIYLLNEAFRA